MSGLVDEVVSLSCCIRWLPVITVLYLFFISAVGNFFVGAHSNAKVGNNQNTVTRYRAFLIIVQMRNVINKGVKIVFCDYAIFSNG